jgi:lysozyme
MSISMNIDQGCINLITQFEGLAQLDQSSGLVYPYLDPANIPTIGYGSTYDINGNPITMNTPPMTVAQCQQLLFTSLQSYVNSVNSMVNVQLTQNQFDALVDFCYNAGAANLAASTLLKMVNAGNFSGAAGQFLLWNKAHVNGQLVVLPGLTRRREAEQALFMTPGN